MALDSRLRGNDETRKDHANDWVSAQAAARPAWLDRSSSYLSGIETGKTSPTIAELDELARLFGTTSIDLLQEATGLNADLEFAPNSDLTRLLTLYQALDPLEKESGLAYFEFLLERQHRQVSS